MKIFTIFTITYMAAFGTKKGSVRVVGTAKQIWHKKDEPNF